MSIVEVAKLAGVSHATVSNVINNSLKVDARTAEAVRAAMKQIGYTPPPLTKRRGRRPKSADGIRSGTIGMIWPKSMGQTNNIKTGIIEGITQELGPHNLKLTITFADDSESSGFAQAISRFDACICLTPLPESVMESLKAKPVVWIGSKGPRSWGDRVSCDHGQVAREAFTYLQRRECKQMIFVNLDHRHPAFFSRKSTFVLIAERAGYKPYVIEPDSGKEGEDPAERAANQLSKIIKKNAGIFVACDQHAAALDRECRRRGLSYPAGAAIIACDNETSALAGLAPRPATFDLQPKQMGELIVSRLLERMRSANMPGQVTIQVPPVFVPGENDPVTLEDIAAHLSEPAD